MKNRKLPHEHLAALEVILLYVGLFLQFADLVTTFVAIHYLGGRELNPVLGWAVHHLPIFFLVKAGISFCLWDLGTRPRTGKAAQAVMIALGVHVALYGWVFVNNVLALLKLGAR